MKHLVPNTDCCAPACCCINQLWSSFLLSVSWHCHLQTWFQKQQMAHCTSTYSESGLMISCICGYQCYGEAWHICLDASVPQQTQGSVSLLSSKSPRCLELKGKKLSCSFEIYSTLFMHPACSGPYANTCSLWLTQQFRSLAWSASKQKWQASKHALSSWMENTYCQYCCFANLLALQHQ